MIDPSEAEARFAQLLAALSRRTASPLEDRDGLLVLMDGNEAVQLVVELSGGGDSVMLVARVMAIPQEDPAGTLALRLLRLNADRDALDGAVIAADGLRRQFVLIRELQLDQEPEALADGVEALLELAAAVRAEAPGERPRVAGAAALLLRTHGVAR
jgi:hypothetical protein